ncbi:MAG: asparagine synthetase B [Alphaproteobacteria bacterium]|nr:asparagine synthetase B [Alphaproteobacteria bacterium]
MTALAGFWAFGAATDPGAATERMLKAQAVYAPAAAAVARLDDLALGRRLRPLLDEDRYDRAPVAAGGGRWTVIADARLDDRDATAEALGIGPAEASRLADSAFVARAVERWEEEAPRHLAGDYAFAAFDRARGRLLLVRDHVGQRPLHFHRGHGFFAFASMPKGLHALPEVPREPDREAFVRDLALLPEEGSGTWFRGIERVPPGHICLIALGRIEMRRWWTPPREPLRLRRTEDYHEAVRVLLDRAVASRLRGAGGAVAAQLSGGLDSSAVTATAARLLAGQGKVHAFTAAPREGFVAPAARGRFADESGHAAAVAALYPNVEHVVVRTGSRSPFDRLDRNAFLYEKPVSNLCNAVWGDAILDAVKARGLNVLLTGQLGNMSFSFSGFERLAELLRRGRLVRLAREALALRRRGGVRLESAAAHAIGPYLPPRLWLAINRWRGRALDLQAYSAIDPAAAARLASEAPCHDFASRPWKDAFASRLWVLGRSDVGPYQKGILGGWGIDLRDPTADRALIELCLTIPLDQYLRGGRSRALARAAFADRLPAIVVDETRKGLQAADWYEGLDAAREDAAEQVARIAALAEAEGVFDTARMRRLVEAWPEEGWSDEATVSAYRAALLRGIASGHFLRRALGTN